MTLMDNWVKVDESLIMPEEEVPYLLPPETLITDAANQCTIFIMPVGDHYYYFHATPFGKAANIHGIISVARDLGLNRPIKVIAGVMIDAVPVEELYHSDQIGRQVFLHELML